MITQTTGKIFLSENRPEVLTAFRRSFANFSNPSKSDALQSHFDETLAAGAHMSFDCNGDLRLIIPVVGAVVVSINDRDHVIAPGEILLVTGVSADSLKIYNRYEKHLVNFLTVGFSIREKKIFSFQMFRFDVQSHRNLLRHLENMHLKYSRRPADCPRLAIGKFGGRAEASFHKSDTSAGVFVFVVDGVFEVQGRLMHPRDGLLLGNEEAMIEVEALSNDAIMILVETNI